MGTASLRAPPCSWLSRRAALPFFLARRPWLELGHPCARPERRGDDSPCPCASAACFPGLWGRRRQRGCSSCAAVSVLKPSSVCFCFGPSTIKLLAAPSPHTGLAVAAAGRAAGLCCMQQAAPLAPSCMQAWAASRPPFPAAHFADHPQPCANGVLNPICFPLPPPSAALRKEGRAQPPPCPGVPFYNPCLLLSFPRPLTLTGCENASDFFFFISSDE